MGYAILLPEIALPPIFELLSAKPREIGALESCKNLRMLLILSNSTLEGDAHSVRTPHRQSFGPIGNLLMKA